MKSNDSHSLNNQDLLMLNLFREFPPTCPKEVKTSSLQKDPIYGITAQTVRIKYQSNKDKKEHITICWLLD